MFVETTDLLCGPFFRFWFFKVWFVPDTWWPYAPYLWVSKISPDEELRRGTFSVKKVYRSLLVSSSITFGIIMNFLLLCVGFVIHRWSFQVMFLFIFMPCFKKCFFRHASDSSQSCFSSNSKCLCGEHWFVVWAFLSVSDSSMILGDQMSLKFYLRKSLQVVNSGGMCFLLKRSTGFCLQLSDPSMFLPRKFLWEVMSSIPSCHLQNEFLLELFCCQREDL